MSTLQQHIYTPDNFSNIVQMGRDHSTDDDSEVIRKHAQEQTTAQTHL